MKNLLDGAAVGEAEPQKLAAEAEKNSKNKNLSESGKIIKGDDETQIPNQSLATSKKVASQQRRRSRPAQTTTAAVRSKSLVKRASSSLAKKSNKEPVVIFSERNNKNSTQQQQQRSKSTSLKRQSDNNSQFIIPDTPQELYSVVERNETLKSSINDQLRIRLIRDEELIPLSELPLNFWQNLSDGKVDISKMFARFFDNDDD